VVNGKSTAIRETIDNIPVTSLYLDDVRTAIISAQNFTPSTPITGFANIRVGHNLSSVYPIYGVAENANNLGGQQAANYFRNNINNSGTGTLSIVNNSGLTIGTVGQLVANISGNSASIVNTITNGSINLRAGIKQLTVDRDTGTITVDADPTTALGVATKQYVDNKFFDTVLTGVPVAPTAPAGTSTTQLATTEFVRNFSGFYSYKIYSGSSWMWMANTGANLQIAGTQVMNAVSNQVNFDVEGEGSVRLTANTKSQSNNSIGTEDVATTRYVKTATQWWGGSAKFVSNAAPNPGVNDIGSNDGDFWFQYSN
jgi:hypothetical protein